MTLMPFIPWLVSRNTTFEQGREGGGVRGKGGGGLTKGKGGKVEGRSKGGEGGGRDKVKERGERKWSKEVTGIYTRPPTDISHHTFS